MNGLASGAKNRNTTALGIIAIVVALSGCAQAIFDGDAATNPDWAACVAAVMSGIGLIFAKDGKTGSQPS